MSSKDMPIVSQQTIQRATREQVNNKSPDFRSVYANNTMFAVSTFDFSMTFGEINAVADGRLSVEQHTKVTMSPVHAKLFLQIFSQQMTQFEQQFGEIKIPVVQTSVPEK